MAEPASGTCQVRVGPSIPMATIDAVVASILGPARVRGNAHPNVLYRDIAMYLCKHAGGWSTARIGRFYNGRDHSTVSYAIRRIESLRASDAAFDALACSLMEQCTMRLEHGPTNGTQDLPRQLLDSPTMCGLVDRIAERVMARPANRIPNDPAGGAGA